MSEYEVKSRMKNFETIKNAGMNRCYSHVQRRFNIRNENYTSPTIYTKENILKKPGVILHIDACYFYCNYITLSCVRNFIINLK